MTLNDSQPLALMFKIGLGNKQKKKMKNALQGKRRISSSVSLSLQLLRWSSIQVQDTGNFCCSPQLWPKSHPLELKKKLTVEIQFF